MISGPSATLGIMLRVTSGGITTISSARDQANSTASAIPAATASA